MTIDYKHSEFNSSGKPDITEVFSSMDISWSKSKEDIWSEMSARMSSGKPQLTMTVNRRSWLRLSVAAAAIVLLCITAVMRFYTNTVYCPAGSHIIADLPDGSTVHMNSNSTLKYYPYWWNFSRRLSFKGEAYFQVAKGKNFVVVSEIGKTLVLGTSFNIYSRQGDYNVTCVTGKVKVVARQTRYKVYLNPNEHAVVDNAGKIKKHKVVAADKISWKDYKFVFTSVPLRQVFEEIARQYGVTINLPDSLDYKYTGNFNKEESVEDVIDLVCLPFNFKFEKKGKSEYQIVRNKSLETK